MATIDNKLGEAVVEATQQLEDSVELIKSHKGEIKEKVNDMQEVAKS